MKTLPMSQMYRVLRGLPGKLLLTAPSGARYSVTIVNPNAPANRCQETLGLCIAVDGPLQGGNGQTFSKELTENELATLRAGNPLRIELGDVALTLRSNPTGQLVSLEN